MHCQQLEENHYQEKQISDVSLHLFPINAAPTTFRKIFIWDGRRAEQWIKNFPELLNPNQGNFLPWAELSKVAFLNKTLANHFCIASGSPTFLSLNFPVMAEASTKTMHGFYAGIIHLVPSKRFVVWLCKTMMMLFLIFWTHAAEWILAPTSLRYTQLVVEGVYIRHPGTHRFEWFKCQMEIFEFPKKFPMNAPKSESENFPPHQRKRSRDEILLLCVVLFPHYAVVAMFAESCDRSVSSGGAIFAELVIALSSARDWIWPRKNLQALDEQHCNQSLQVIVAS